MDGAARSQLERALGTRVVSSTPVSGGDINHAERVLLADGTKLFVKSNPAAAPGTFEAEARGLRWLAQAGALHVPEVLAVSGGSQGQFLALAYLEQGQPRAGFDAELGAGLARLHRFGADAFGLDHDNFIGRLPQPNTPAADWASFYRERRLLPQLARARAARLLCDRLERAFERLWPRLPELVGPAEPPARLHGDLWSGNVFVSERGEPVLIDPAVYGGQREVDLAMMRLFGGFTERVFSAYAEAFPLAAGHRERVSLYQLYPLLVHLNHFGNSYVAPLLREVERLL
jgi:fructosamine-3-kinase